MKTKFLIYMRVCNYCLHENQEKHVPVLCSNYIRRAVCSKNPKGSLKDVRANCFCASLLRTQIHATSCMSARALSNKMNK